MYDAKVPQIWRKVSWNSQEVPSGELYMNAGVLGVINPGVLVHRTVRAKHTILQLDLHCTTQCILDDRLFQPSRVPDCNEAGGDTCPQRLGIG